MSAFAVIYERTNTPVQPGVLVRVMDRLDHRGPDGSDTRVTGRVALGHWHFWTTPEELGERQPLQVEGLPFTIVMDGRLDNRSDLVAELALLQQASRLSDTALVLHAYERWGEHCFEHFIGEFAIVIHDEKRNELICARDALGDRTLFYCMHGSQIVIASEPWAVAGAKGTNAELHEGAIAHYFALETPENGQTLFQNIYELLPAHVMVVNATGERTWKHWQPDFSRRLPGLTNEAYAEQFLHLLEQSVRSRLRSITPVGVLMSGGLDSTSVASLAARALAPTPITSVSYVFNEIPSCDERQYIDAMVKHWGIRSIQLPCDDLWPYKDWPNWPHNPNSPEGNLYRLLKERAYQKAKQEGLRVLLTGGFGDHLYTGADEWLADLLAEGQVRIALRELLYYLRYAGWRWSLDKGFIQYAVKRFLNKFPGRGHAQHKHAEPAWLTPFASEQLRQARSNPVSPHQKANIVGTRAAWDSSGETYNTSRHEIELRHPYRDRRLVEFMLSVPAYQFYYRGLYKRILRNAMQGILPEVIRTRLYPTTMIELVNRGVEREHKTLNQHLLSPNINGYKFINKEWLLKHWGVPIRPETDGPGTLIPWFFLSFESWYGKLSLSN